MGIEHQPGSAETDAMGKKEAKLNTIYIAARYDRINEMNTYSTQLINTGFKVNSRWLKGTRQIHPSPEKVDNNENNVAWEARPFAQDDLEDIKACDTLIFFAEPANSHFKRGGRHVEFGIALALGKRIMVVGNRENVFHCLPQVEHYDNFEQCLGAIRYGPLANFPHNPEV